MLVATRRPGVCASSRARLAEWSRWALTSNAYCKMIWFTRGETVSRPGLSGAGSPYQVPDCCHSLVASHARLLSSVQEEGGDSSMQSGQGALPHRRGHKLVIPCWAVPALERRAGGRVKLVSEDVSRWVCSWLQGPPKPCEMALTIHGTCVANELERSQKLGEKYWTQGGEDRCLSTRSRYEVRLLGRSP